MRAPLLLGLLLAACAVATAGCSLDGQVVVQFSGTAPASVTETIKPEQTPHRLAGVTRRSGQRAAIDCAITMAYDVREATGTAVLIQRLVVRLRTRPLPRGTRYAFDCLGPLVTELPADATGIRASATSESGDTTGLRVRGWTPSVLVGFGRRLRPSTGAQLAVVGWPAQTPPGSYRIDLSFELPTAHPFRQRGVFTASVSCGRSTYVQPLLPPVSSMKAAWSLAVRPSANATTLPLPRLAAGISSQSQRTVTLACVR